MAYQIDPSAFAISSKSILGRHYNDSPVLPYAPDAMRITRDPLLARQGLILYQEMGRDDMVDLGLWLLITSLLPDTRLIPARGTRDAKLICDKIAGQFDRVPGGITRKFQKCALAFLFGFSISEQCFSLCKEGQDAGDIELSDIKYRQPYFFDFWADKQTGELDYILQIDTAGNLREKIDLRKVIYFVVNDHVDPFRGMSIYRPSYWAWWQKQAFAKLRGIQAERRAGKLRMKHADPQYVDPTTFKDVASNILENYQKSDGFVLPPGVDADVVTGEESPETYTKLIQECDRVLLRPTKIPWLMVQEGIQSGSYALADIQSAVMQGAHKAHRQDLQEKLNEPYGPIWWICELNGWSHADAPRIAFEPAVEADRRKAIELYNASVSAGSLNPQPQDQNWIRAGLGLEEIDEAELADVAKPVPATFADASAPKQAKAIDRVDFAQVDRGLQDIVDRQRDGLNAAWKDSLAALHLQVDGWVSSDRVTAGAMLRKAGGASMILDGFVSKVVDAGMDAYAFGTASATRELFDSGLSQIKKPKAAAKFQASDPVGPDNPFSLDAYKKLLEAKSLRIASKMEAQVVNRVQLLLENCYENGVSIEETRKRLASLFDDLAAGHMISPGRADGYDYTSEPIQETTVRTIANTAFNGARQDLYQRNSDWVKGYEISEVAGGRDGQRSHPLSQHLDGLKVAYLLVDGSPNPYAKQFAGAQAYNDRKVDVALTVMDEPIKWSSQAELAKALRWKEKLSLDFV